MTRMRTLPTTGQARPCPHPRHRSVLDRILRRSVSRPGAAARGRAAGLSRQMERLWRGAPCRGPCRAERSRHVLFQPRRRPERFRQGEAVAAAEPDPRGRSAGAYPHPRGAQPGAVADRDEADPRSLRRRRRRQGRRIAGAAQLRRHRRSGGSLSAVDLSRCARAEAGGPRASAALCGRRLQRIRTAQPAAPGARSSGRRRIRPMSPSSASATISRPADSAPASMRASMPATSPRPRRRCWCARCCRPGSIPPSTASVRRSIAWRAIPDQLRAAAQRPVAGAQRVRGSRAVREPGADLLPHHHARCRDRRSRGSAKARRC